MLKHFFFKKNNTVNYDYDVLNRINSVSSNGVTNSYIYNNDLLSQINHNGFSYFFNYNNFNNVTNIKVNNQDLITNNYEANNGNLLSSTYGNNDLVSFTYDSFNRLSTKVKEDKTYTYLYDNSNNLAVKKDDDNTCKYTYDLASRLTEYIQNNDYKINYKYDNRNNVSKVDYSLNDVVNTSTYSYDNDSKQMSYTVNNNRVIYDYDLFSRLSTKKISNFITTYEYLDLEDNKTTTLLDSITNDEETIRYVYDELGNIEEIYKNEVLENEYEYDALNQLVLEKTYSLNQKIEYTYDLGGNILTKVYKNLETDAIINTYSYGYDSVWKDKLISYNGESITYDEIGNPLTYGDITYSWINGRELSSYTDTSSELEVEYSYNDEGIRVSKVINGVEHKYYLEGSSIVYEVVGEDTLYYFYDSNGSIEGFKYNDDIYYYIKNGQNDIIGIVDIEGNQIVSYEYDSWGQIVSIKDNQGNEITDQTNIGNINPFRYRSYYYDSETELYYLNSRYYNPEVGRFINADTISAVGNFNNIYNKNIYSYTDNNPINRIDTEGKAWWALASGVFGALVGGVTKVATNIIEGESWSNGIFGSMVGGFFTGALLTTTFNPALAYYSGALMESMTNEIVGYASGKKSLTLSNVKASQSSVVVDTFVNGTAGVITHGIGKSLKITNDNWFKPQKFITSFTGNYAKKTILENIITSPMQYGLSELFSPSIVFASTTKNNFMGGVCYSN